MFGYGVDGRINNKTELFSLRGISGGVGVVIFVVLLFSVFRVLKRLDTIIIAMEINTEQFSIENGKSYITAAILAAVIISSVGTLKLFYDEPFWGNPNMGYVTGFLVENGYTKGYASFLVQ